ncbi:hypothetical protein E4U43_000496 [Claviceps pusilla]|uniref:Uncharacterized protein n=1 Tax=Claviceps pusilla TaxID=123648 RepID=A0A9P7NBT2_9HYPO|nr:hypothetical protein E4U43_000496 [Claviceps pusilla]
MTEAFQNPVYDDFHETQLAEPGARGRVPGPAGVMAPLCAYKCARGVCESDRCAFVIASVIGSVARSGPPGPAGHPKPTGPTRRAEMDSFHVIKLNQLITSEGMEEGAMRALSPPGLIKGVNSSGIWLNLHR